MEAQHERARLVALRDCSGEVDGSGDEEKRGQEERQREGAGQWKRDEGNARKCHQDGVEDPEAAPGARTDQACASANAPTTSRIQPMRMATVTDAAAGMMIASAPATIATAPVA